jgi:diaminohydroxyphosphoribosylaminopyrimidine deaminase/5-amino-6-(5-phosphoribosylamino)uracil reductase
MGQKFSDEEAMIQALRLAYQGEGFVSPNPQVGCVILDKNSLYLGSGYHQKWGEGHAEVNALKGISSELLKGARVFVTLEPCAHQGMTPSCAKTLAQLPISEVIYALEDPNPLVAGRGAEILRQAGKKAVVFQTSDRNLAHEIRKVCEVFLKNFVRKEPFVALKWAQSLDGKMSLGNLESRWITNDESRLEAHRLRAIYDLTVVGVETFLRDNPRLDIRHPRFLEKKNKVAVLDPQGRALLNPDLDKFSVFKHHDLSQVLWIVGSESEYESDSEKLSKASSKEKLKGAISRKFEGRDISIHSLEIRSNKYDLSQLLKLFFDLQIKSVLVEGGPSTLSQFIKADLWDRLHVFQAPVIIGEQEGQRSWAGKSNWTSMAQACHLRLDEAHYFKSDLYQSFVRPT